MLGAALRGFAGVASRAHDHPGSRRALQEQSGPKGPRISRHERSPASRYLPHSAVSERLSVPAIMCITATGIISFFVNLSIFLVIGRASPIAYNVLGHCKLSLVIVGGFTFFGAPLEAKNLFGVLITLMGVAWYTYLKLNAPKEPPKPAAVVATAAADDELVPADGETVIDMQAQK